VIPSLQGIQEKYRNWRVAHGPRTQIVEALTFLRLVHSPLYELKDGRGFVEILLRVEAEHTYR